MARIAATYMKVPFEWPGDRPLRRAPARPPSKNVEWHDADRRADFTDIVAQALAASVDASDRAAVNALGAQAAAERLVQQTPGFSRLPGWWQVVALEGAAVGFVLPVTYDGCARDGLDEATIYHVGVVPHTRGRGVGRLLLRRAMETLLDHGVWRIYCDTAADNAPMIHLFEAEGWTRHAARERPVFAFGE